MSTTDVGARIGRMIEEDISDRRAQNYHQSWRDACGASERTKAPEPMIPRSGEGFEIHKGNRMGSTWCWTKKADELGNWWSFRAVSHGPLLAETFDNWEAHKQRQAAKTCARASAGIERSKQPAK